VTILLVGAGKMGSHFYDHWQRDDVVMDPPLNLNPMPQLVDAIVVAVKPQTAPEAFPAVVPFIGPDTVVVSIMAGRTLAYLRSALPPVAIVRAMPSMAGISVAIAFVAEEQHSPERRPSGARRNASRYLKVGTVKRAGVSNRNRSTTTAL
jgi:hypothetical protein